MWPIRNSFSKFDNLINHWHTTTHFVSIFLSHFVFCGQWTVLNAFFFFNSKNVVLIPQFGYSLLFGLILIILFLTCFVTVLSIVVGAESSDICRFSFNTVGILASILLWL